MRRLALIALQVFTFSIPLANVLMLPGVGTIARLFGMIACGAAVFAVASTGKIRKPHPAYIPMVLFVAWTMVSLCWTLDRNGATYQTNLYFQLLVMAWLVWEFASNRETLRGLVKAYVLGASVSAGWTVSNFLRGQGIAEYVARYSTDGFDPNMLAILILLSLPLAYWLGLQYEKGFGFWFYRAHMVVAVGAIFLTSSRTATLATLAVGVLIPWVYRGQSQRQKMILATTFVVGVVGVLSFVPNKSWERLSTIGAEVESGSMNYRGVIWKAGLNALWRSPIVGLGSGAFGDAVAPELGRERAAHSAFLAVLVDGGVIGLTLYLGIIGVAMHAVWRSKMTKIEKRLALALITGWTVGAIAGNMQHQRATWFVFALLAAWSAVPPPSAATQHLWYRLVLRDRSTAERKGSIRTI